MSESKHTPGKWVWHTHDEETWRIYGTAQLRDGPADGCYVIADVINGNGDERQNAANRDLIAAAPALADIVARLTLATDEHDDKAMGTHYVDKAGVIRCKGSFLELVEAARAALALVEGA